MPKIDQPAEIVREYGPFPGVPDVHGVSFDGQSVWFAAGETLRSFDPVSGEARRSLDLPGDAGTAFEILSIDIADVDVGRNIGAELQTDQAEADKKIAQAKAEERRAMAMAAEQEMRARVVEAEAQVPLAMAEAFRSGNLGVMDYYKMENIQSDTRMRGSIAGDEQEQQR